MGENPEYLCSCWDIGETARVSPDVARLIKSVCCMYVCITPKQCRADFLVQNFLQISDILFGGESLLRRL
jgi:hypothetical protein